MQARPPWPERRKIAYKQQQQQQPLLLLLLLIATKITTRQPSGEREGEREKRPTTGNPSYIVPYGRRRQLRRVHWLSAVAGAAPFVRRYGNARARTAARWRRRRSQLAKTAAAVTATGIGAPDPPHACGDTDVVLYYARHSKRRGRTGRTRSTVVVVVVVVVSRISRRRRAFDIAIAADDIREPENGTTKSTRTTSQVSEYLDISPGNSSNPLTRSRRLRLRYIIFSSDTADQPPYRLIIRETPNARFRLLRTYGECRVHHVVCKRFFRRDVRNTSAVHVS